MKLIQYAAQSNALMRLRILLRNKLNVVRFPVGVDIDGNLYFDDGLTRKVLKPGRDSIEPVVVLEDYSKWLRYKTNEFPVLDKKELDPEPSSHEPFDLNKKYKFCLELIKKGKIIYSPNVDLIVFFKLGESYSRICI